MCQTQHGQLEAVVPGLNLEDDKDKPQTICSQSAKHYETLN